MSPEKFRKVVWAHYRKHGRHDLPWRHTRDPYKILVSEVMLQQTRVERVVPYYRAFLKKFPTARRLAGAPLSEVLRAWQGLGYNRRAKLVRAAAQEIVARHASHVPRDIAELERLPGVGPYTARAVAAFAFTIDTVFVETNIRTAVMHHFFPKRKKVADKEIKKMLMRARPPGGRARQWNYALMDYGAFLKRSGVRLNAKSKHYARQARFEGSMRQARGAILKELARGDRSEPRLLALLSPARLPQMRAALAALAAEGLVARSRKRYALAEAPPSLIRSAKGMPRSMRVPSGMKSS